MNLYIYLYISLPQLVFLSHPVFSGTLPFPIMPAALPSSFNYKLFSNPLFHTPLLLYYFTVQQYALYIFSFPHTNFDFPFQAPYMFPSTCPSHSQLKTFHPKVTNSILFLQKSPSPCHTLLHLSFSIFLPISSFVPTSIPLSHFSYLTPFRFTP